MIRIVMLGRTGNNLFQYALGRVLAEKHGVPLVLDASWFNAEGWREVSHFLNLPLKAKVLRRASLASRALRKFTNKHYWEYRGVPIFRESVHDQSFDPRFLDAPADCLLFGYFQSPRYFEKIAISLRTELNSLIAGSVAIPPVLHAKLTHPDSVAIHVRRKDYLELPIFQVCDNAYYHNSIRLLRARLPNARFFIFSDDPEWCHSKFQESDQEVIESCTASANPLYEMRLMSLASHHIIANSSYSWWAAWLGEKPEQEVIMPDRWYAHGINAPMDEKSWKVTRLK